jgi:hypothetical protein
MWRCGTLVGTPRHITLPYGFWHHDGQRHTTFTTVLWGSPDEPVCRSDASIFGTISYQPSFRRRGDTAALQAILGHKTIAVTMRYAHMIISHLHKAMSTFDAKPGTKAGTTGTYFSSAGLNRLSVTGKMQSLGTERGDFEPSIPRKGYNGFRDRVISTRRPNEAPGGSLWLNASASTD